MFQSVNHYLSIRAKNPLIADQIAVNYRKADIAPRQRAMLDFAMKVSLEAGTISEQDFAALASHGFSDDDAWDIAAISAFFALSNRMANVTAMRPNDEILPDGPPAEIACGASRFESFLTRFLYPNWCPRSLSSGAH
jgi:uncharacterized protein YciW